MRPYADKLGSFDLSPITCVVFTCGNSNILSNVEINLISPIFTFMCFPAYGFLSSGPMILFVCGFVCVSVGVYDSVSGKIGG